MRFRLTNIAAIICVWLCFAPSLVAQSEAKLSSPTAAVRSFYNFHLANNTSFTTENVNQRRAWLAPDLYRLLLNEFRREAEWVKANPDQVPYFNGDPFTNSQELPSSFRVAEPVLQRNKAVVNVTFVWSDQGRTVAERTVSVGLTKHRKGWLISNVFSNDVDSQGVDLRKQLLRKVYQP